MPGMFDITVNISDCQDKINTLRDNMSPEAFRRAMYGVMRRTSRHVAVILKKDLPQKYEVKPGPIGAAVKSPHLSDGAGGVGCTIPISGKRGDVGGVFRASGGAHGWNSMRRTYRIKVRVLKGKQSNVEDTINGFKPFRNLSSSKVAYVRTSKKRLPVDKVMRIAIPQMPMNRSQAAVQKDIRIYLEKQIDQRIRAMMMGK